MGAIVRDLMSAPPVTCDAASSLASAARRMQGAGIGSVVVVERGKVTGILTERDLLRAAAAGVRPTTEPVRLWMTAGPDVLGPDEEASTAWESLTHHHYRHLPVVEDGELLGVVSIRDLYRSALPPTGRRARHRRAARAGGRGGRRDHGGRRARRGGLLPLPPVPGGGAGGPPVARGRLVPAGGGRPPGPRRRRSAFGAQVASLRTLPEGLASLLAELAKHGTPLDVLRTAVSLLGAELGLGTDPRHRSRHPAPARRCSCALPCRPSSPPRTGSGRARSRSPRGPTSPSPPTTCGCCRGPSRRPSVARAVEQYLMLVIDHGFNASTFTARVITSTGADLAAAICGAIGALSGPLHGGAPSRALDMLDAIGPDGAGRATGPRRGCATPWSGVTGSWGSDTGCTRPRIRGPCSFATWPGHSEARWWRSPPRWSGWRSTCWPS